jgi:hypothetical protein
LLFKSAAPPALIGSGPNGGNQDWTRRFFGKLAKAGTLGRLWGWAMHNYSWNASAGRTTDWNAGKRDALKFCARHLFFRRINGTTMTTVWTIASSNIRKSIQSLLMRQLPRRLHIARGGRRP